MTAPEAEYRPIRPLGEGGMGSVHLAEQVQLGRLVAVKALQARHLGNADTVARLKREALLLRSLSHPNLVRLLDARLDGDTPFLVFEYIEGSCSLDVVIERAEFTRATALSTFRGILEGLAELHRHGIVHRDVKPANVLTGADGRPRLIDLGLGREVNADETRLTQQGQVLGTLAYMPPEQLLGGDANELSDLYAAALVGAELLANHFLFTPRAPGGAISAPERVNAGSLRLHEKLPGVPPQLTRLLERCLARDPKDRPASVAAVLEALDRAEASGDVPDAPTARLRGLEAGQTASGLRSARRSLRTAVPSTASAVAASPPPWWWAYGLAGLATLGVLAAVWTRRPAAPAPAVSPFESKQIVLQEDSHFRWTADGLVLEAHLSAPARMELRDGRSPGVIAVSPAVDVHHSLLVGSRRLSMRAPSLVAVGATGNEHWLALDRLERRAVEMALQHLTVASPGDVLARLDRRLARAGAVLADPALGQLPESFGDRVAALRPWIIHVLRGLRAFDALELELWNRIDAWGALEDWCCARSVRWRDAPSELLPPELATLMVLDTPRWQRLLEGLELTVRDLTGTTALWGGTYTRQSAESALGWLAMWNGAATAGARSNDALDASVGRGSTPEQARLAISLPDRTDTDFHAWIGFKPVARKATSQIIVVFENGARLRLPMIGHQPDWFRYRRLPHGFLRHGQNEIRLRFEKTPGAVDAEPQLFYNLHLLLTVPETPSGPDLYRPSSNDSPPENR